MIHTYDNLQHRQTWSRIKRVETLEIFTTWLKEHCFQHIKRGTKACDKLKTTHGSPCAAAIIGWNNQSNARTSLERKTSTFTQFTQQNKMLRLHQQKTTALHTWWSPHSCISISFAYTAFWKWHTSSTTSSSASLLCKIDMGAEGNVIPIEMPMSTVKLKFRWSTTLAKSSTAITAFGVHTIPHYGICELIISHHSHCKSYAFHRGPTITCWYEACDLYSAGNNYNIMSFQIFLFVRHKIFTNWARHNLLTDSALKKIT